MSISQIQNYKHPAPYLENYTGNEYDTHSNSISCARFTIDCDYDHEFYDSFDDTVQLVRVGQAKAQPRSQYQPLACALALALALGAGFCVGVVAGPFFFFLRDTQGSTGTGVVQIAVSIRNVSVPSQFQTAVSIPTAEGVLIATHHCQRASLPEAASSSPPMLPGAPGRRRCPRLPECQTTPELLSVPLVLHTFFSAPPALQP